MVAVIHFPYWIPSAFGALTSRFRAIANCARYSGPGRSGFANWEFLLIARGEIPLGVPSLLARRSHRLPNDRFDMDGPQIASCSSISMFTADCDPGRVNESFQTTRIDSGRTSRARSPLSNIVGHSPSMRALVERIRRVANASVPVILLGETGVGKNLVARAIHESSPRAPRSFVSINCAALPAALLESELFGYVKGAFTGAAADHSGLLAEAHGGSLFLDEIAEMTQAMQAKLLHVLERKTLRAVGSRKEREVDLRIIAATHRDLAQEVKDGRFRKDLLYRLDVVSIVVPPLRDRPEDIPEILQYFLEQVRGRYPEASVQRFSREALAELGRYNWPGNIRELAHMVERLVLLGSSPEVTVADLPVTILRESNQLPFAFHGRIVPLRELERRYVAWAVAQTGGHRNKAARELGVDPKTLRKWLGQVDGDDGMNR